MSWLPHTGQGRCGSLRSGGRLFICCEAACMPACLPTARILTWCEQLASRFPRFSLTKPSLCPDLLRLLHLLRPPPPAGSVQRSWVCRPVQQAVLQRGVAGGVCDCQRGGHP